MQSGNLMEYTVVDQSTFSPRQVIKMEGAKAVKQSKTKWKAKSIGKRNHIVTNLPDEVLQEIFVYIPGHDLVSLFVCVCKRWAKIIQSQRLWKRKCTLDHGYKTEMMKLMMTDDDFRKLYFTNPYNRNLILNPEALEGFKHWKMKVDGEFRVETKHIGVTRGSQFSKYKDGTIQCWIPTYRNHSKEQIIDLIGRGCTPRMLDQVRPCIVITDWFSGHYELTVELLKTLQDNAPMVSHVVKLKKPFDGRLYRALLTVKDYDPGLRYIRFKHSGRQLTKRDHYDDCCTKITLSSVRFDLTHDQ